MKKIDGKPVGDGLMPLRLEVTEQDIKKGARLNQNSCAVAVAAMRQIKGCTAAKAHLGVVYLQVNGKWRRWHTPDPMRTEIIVFDRGGTFVPREFFLYPPTPEAVRKKAAKVARRATTGGAPVPEWRRRFPRAKPHRTEGVRDPAWKADE